MNKLNRPAPGPNNAGITPGYRPDGEPVKPPEESDSFAERIRNLERRMDRVAKWAQRKHEQVQALTAEIADLKIELRRLQEIANDRTGEGTRGPS